jgi:hypothetical protein
MTFLKKIRLLTIKEKKQWIDKNQKGLSLAAQCKLLGIPRSSYYYQQVPISQSELWLMRHIDEMYTARPFLGSRKITENLRREGLHINRKHVQRIMRRLSIAPVLNQDLIPQNPTQNMSNSLIYSTAWFFPHPSKCGAPTSPIFRFSMDYVYLVA